MAPETRRERSGVATVERIGDAANAYERHGAVCARMAIPPTQAREIAARVLAARDAWTPAFDGEQWSLGRAFYTHLEEGLDGEYFVDAAGSDAVVEAHAPGLQEMVRQLATLVLGAEVSPRTGFCGPGVHVFLPGDVVARDGGAIHFDTEGLTPAQLTKRTPAATLVLMLQPPGDRGGTKVWDTPYRGYDHPTDADVRQPFTTVEYGAGDLLVLDAYRLHQIQPFTGVERVSATVHLAQRPDGDWESWF